ncbi:MAG: HAMP domain-containing sensor histidine kinase [Bacillota bacterium]|nr:HAMP domain-containing sensor histidine kinase [Bacillota bacterium]
MQRDNIRYFVHCMPRFHELIGKSGAVGVYDREKCLIHLNGTKVVLPVKEGDPINKKGIVYQAMKEGRRVIRKFGREPHTSYIGISIPLKDENGEAIGAIVASQPIRFDPLFDIVDTAEQIDAGNLAKRFPSRQGQMEIDRLAESFNKMLERLETSFAVERETKEQMRRFIADASHELRTPLTSISGFLEVLRRGAADDPEQLYQALTSMYDESERLKKLVDDLLYLTKLEQKPQIELREGSLDALLFDMEPQLRILAGKRKLHLDVKPNIRFNFDRDRIKQVILNLFHNAIQYTDPKKGFIKITLIKKNSGVQLTFQDNGPGISKKHLPNIFNRFYRSDSSRTRKNGGSGLGLTIAKSIVELHGGNISVTSRRGEGSTFYVWLPLKPPVQKLLPAVHSSAFKPQ